MSCPKRLGDHELRTNGFEARQITDVFDQWHSRRQIGHRHSTVLALRASGRGPIDCRRPRSLHGTGALRRASYTGGSNCSFASYRRNPGTVQPPEHRCGLAREARKLSRTSEQNAPGYRPPRGALASSQRLERQTAIGAQGRGSSCRCRWQEREVSHCYDFESKMAKFRSFRGAGEKSRCKSPGPQVPHHDPHTSRSPG
jgi:hypothetical protein